MEKSVLVKLVWLGAVTAIPVAVLAVQKPEVHVVSETRRVITVDRPIAIDFAGGELAGKAAGAASEAAKPVEPPRPRPMVLGSEKITIGAAGEPATLAQRAAPEDTRSAAPVLPRRDQSVAAAVAPVPGPRP